ncbi:MAG: hypothetical protein ACO3UU_14340, partial [Minisyncoccia bacterium]
TDTSTGAEETYNDKVGIEFIDNDMSATDDDRTVSGQYSDVIGIDRDNFYRLDVKANTININANIMTWEEQIYRSPVVVGSNDDSLVKFVISIDPAVTFLSTVRDSGDDGTHTLVIRAIELRDNAYIITYSAPSVSSSSSSSSSSSRLVNILKSLTEAGNNGSILDFFKNLGRTGGENRVFVKSIEIITGDEARTGRSDSSTTNESQQDFKRFNNKGSAECSEEQKLQTECKNQ